MTKLSYDLSRNPDYRKRWAIARKSLSTYGQFESSYTSWLRVACPSGKNSPKQKRSLLTWDTYLLAYDAATSLNNRQGRDSKCTYVVRAVWVHKSERLV